MGADAELTELVPAIVLQAGSATVALAADQVEKLVVPQHLLRVPLAPPALRGVMLEGGEPALVVDLSPGNAVAEAGAANPAGIVCRAGGERVVLVGGQVRHVGRLRLVPGGELAAEWRGTAVPLLSVAELLATATISDEELPSYEGSADHEP